MRSQGSLALQRTGATQKAIAESLGISRIAVSKWWNGQSKPDGKRREQIRERYGIDVALWDAPLTQPARTKKAARSAEETRTPAQVPDGVLGKAKALEDMVHDMMVELQASSAAPLEKSRVMNSCAVTLNLVAKITGQFELGSKLFKLPIWRKIEQALQRGLEGHPKAAAAVAAELRRVEAEQVTIVG